MLPRRAHLAVFVRHPVFQRLLHKEPRVYFGHAPFNVVLVKALQVRWDVKKRCLAARSGGRWGAKKLRPHSLREGLHAALTARGKELEPILRCFVPQVRSSQRVV